MELIEETSTGFKKHLTVNPLSQTVELIEKRHNLVQNSLILSLNFIQEAFVQSGEKSFVIIGSKEIKLSDNYFQSSI